MVTFSNPTIGLQAIVRNNKLIMLFLLFLPSLLFAQENQKAPTGKQIAAAAKNNRLLDEFKQTDIFMGKKITLTPTEIIDSTKAGNNGLVFAVLENEIAGDETNLAPGRYNLFLAYVDNKWHVYAESNGVIVKEALRVSVEQSKDEMDKKIKIVFRNKGWGYNYYFFTPVSRPCYAYRLPDGTISAYGGAGARCLYSFYF